MSLFYDYRESVVRYFSKCNRGAWIIIERILIFVERDTWANTAAPPSDRRAVS